MPKEAWAEIIGYKGFYEVSTLGRVKSLTRTTRRKGVTTRVLKGKLKKIVKLRYPMVMLYMNAKMKNCTVHRLVAKAFVPNPNNLPEVNHKDGNKHNNIYTNLEWTTRRGNAIHAVALGLFNPAQGEGCPQSKLTEQNVLDIRSLALQDVPGKILCIYFRIARTTINQVIARRTWKHL